MESPLATLPQRLDHPQTEPYAAPRLLSLDVFRGIIIAGMILVTDPGTYSARYAPLCHSGWAGPTATDIISPAFLLMVGIAIPFAFASRLAGGATRSRLLLHVLRRSALLILIGLFLNSFPGFDLHTLRILGILQHIALCYAGASLIYVAAGPIAGDQSSARRRGLTIAGAAAALLGVYWALLKYVPAPGFGPGRLDSLGSLPAYVDRATFGVQHLWPYGTTPGYGVTFDPDGLLSTISVFAITLIGVVAGEWLRTPRTRKRKFAVLADAAAWLTLAGYGSSFFLPMIKKIWTSSFSLFSAGIALLLFSCLYYILDIRQWKRWAKPFLVFGTNAILAFALSTVITTLLDRIHIAAGARAVSLHTWSYQHLFATWLQPRNASLAYAVAIVLLNLALIYPLYRKHVFLRL